MLGTGAGGKTADRGSATAKLTDFGIGHVVSAEALAGITVTGRITALAQSTSSAPMGTHAYLAPEVLMGRPAMLSRMFDRRCRGYEAFGYRIVLPASAILGWPADVLLPSDPVWKRDYPGSVRRLVRDRVDTPLAMLFVHVARPVSPDAEAVDRARSATEAFLFRRLETLPETRGRFQLNTTLPIPFDGFGRLEVDLLCDDARVAVGLDGAQHLGDPVAYRRDRRKDHLLQENGYLVLRFLAEDVGKELDAVLDTTLRALSSRGQSGHAPHVY